MIGHATLGQFGRHIGCCRCWGGVVGLRDGQSGQHVGSAGCGRWPSRPVRGRA